MDIRHLIKVDVAIFNHLLYLIGCGGYGYDVEIVAATMISEACAQMKLDETGRIHISIIIESNKPDIFNVFSKHAKVKQDRLKRMLSSDGSILNWKIVDDKYPLRVNLSESSKEYGDVLRSFQETMKINGIQGRIRIERIQNERLFRQYQTERDHFYEKLNQDTERILYHGCPNDDKRLTSIIENGFDRSRAGQQTGLTDNIHQIILFCIIFLSQERYMVMVLTFRLKQVKVIAIHSPIIKRVNESCLLV